MGYSNSFFTESFYSQLKSDISASHPDQLDLEFEIDAQNADETHQAANLIKAGILPPNIFATKEWLAECIKRLEHPALSPTTINFLYELHYDDIEDEHFAKVSETNHVSYDYVRIEALAGLESDWKSYDKLQDHSREIASSLPNNVYENAIEMFVYEINRGDFPPPEILIVLAKCFSLYFEAEGALSLEEVFFGSPRKRSGNYAKRRFTGRLYRLFDDSLRREIEWEKYSDLKHFDGLQDFTAKFLFNLGIQEADSDEEIEAVEYDWDRVETFLRGYRRWKKNNSE